MRSSTPSSWLLRSRGATKPLSSIAWDRENLPRFASDDVPEEDLQTILTLASRAPSASSLQPWRFIVVQDQDQRDRLREAAYHQPCIAQAPVVVVAHGLRSAWTREGGEMRPRLPGDPPSGSSGHEIALWLNRHVMVAFTYLMVAAEAMGWDTVPIERFDASATARTLSLPGDAELVALLAIGRFEHAEDDVPKRIPLEELVCSERWGVAWSDPIVAGR